MKIELVGRAPAFTRLMNAVRLVAATDAPVLLLGEPGPGKASLAREIHALSPRRGDPFVSFTCTGAASGDLADGISRIGAERATLHLHEVADLSAEDQARLVRIIGQQAAGQTPSLRIIAASNQDLAEAAELGRFRRDLHQRLCVVPLDVPPLRERVLDIPELTGHFLALASARHRVRAPRLRPGAERLLRLYSWPGNLRELSNLCERLTILLPGAEVSPESLPAEVRRGDGGAGGVRGFELPPQGIDLNGLEAELIRQALALAGGNKSRAARLLGLTRDTLLYRLQKHLIPG